MSGCAIGGVSCRQAPVFQRDVFSGPRVGLSHSYGRGVASSGLLVLKFQR